MKEDLQDYFDEWRASCKVALMASFVMAASAFCACFIGFVAKSTLGVSYEITFAIVFIAFIVMFPPSFNRVVGDWYRSDALQKQIDAFNVQRAAEGTAVLTKQAEL